MSASTLLFQIKAHYAGIINWTLAKAHRQNEKKKGGKCENLIFSWYAMYAACSGWGLRGSSWGDTTRDT